MNNTLLQQRAFNKLNRLKVGALFASMGTGKTKVALDLIASKGKKVKFALWICPYSLKGTIEAERQKWQPNLDLTVVGCESIGSSDRIYLELRDKMAASDCCFVVVDESLKIKNLKAKRTKRILELSQFASYKLILNGTPVTRNILDLYSQIRFLSPKILNESFLAFKHKYCEFYIRGKLKGKIKKNCNVPHLISRIKPYIYDAELDLKVAKRYHTHSYSFNLDELSEYENIKVSYLDNVSASQSDIDFYALISDLHKFINTCESKREAVQHVLDTVDGKVVIFVRHLASIPENALKIIGDMKTVEREQVIQQFKDGSDKALYITFGCGAFGLNLQFCNNLIFADRTWDLAQMEQAEARIYRLGQKEDNVNYYYIDNTSAGLERMISRNLEKKSDLLSEVKVTISDMDIKEKTKWLKKYL